MAYYWTSCIVILLSLITYTYSAKNYSLALQKSILFYDAQRSGKLPANNPIPWRGDAALTDCVVGGWFDNGDQTKFGLPMSSAATLLLWGLNRFKDGYALSGQTSAMLDSIKWPLDYLLKAWNPISETLVVQIGDPETDHSWWGRPEDMTMYRPCLVVNATIKGSDIAAGTAAALAAGSIVFLDNGDTDYSQELLTSAESLYSFAKANRGVFKTAGNFYTSTADRDEMCEASIWLYKATRQTSYLNDAKSFSDAYSWGFTWDDKTAACLQLLYEETQDPQYRNSLVSFINSFLPGGDVTYTPCGLAWRSKWSPNSFKMADHHDDDVKPTEEDGEDLKEEQSENTRNSRTKSPKKTQKKKSTSKSPSRKGRANKIYRTPVTPEPEELLFREKSFVLDCNATSSISRDYSKVNPKLGPVVPPYNSQKDRHVNNYFSYFGVKRTLEKNEQNLNKSTSIDGPVVDKFHREGAGAVYLKLRNEFGAGHSQETINGHAQFMQGVKEVQGYNGKYGFRRNTPFLRQQPTPFEPAIILPTH